MTPVIISWRPIYLAGLRQYFNIKTAPKQIPALWRKLTPHFGKITGEIPERSFGASFPVDAEGFDYVAGVGVKNAGVELPEGFVLCEIPENTYAVFEHRGHVQTLPATIDRIWSDWFPKQTEWQAAGDVTTPVLLEVYDERFDPGQGSGVVELWVAVKKAS